MPLISRTLFLLCAKVKVVSQADPDKYYIMNSLDIVVIPASLGKYTIENLGVGSVTVHKTLLKKI